MTATALVGAGLSVYQTVKSSKEKKDAAAEASAYQRDGLINPSRDIQLSTYGTDIMREESARNSASMIDAAKGGGARTVMGLIPRIQASQNKVNQEIGMNLENQDLKRQYAIAQGEQNIMGIKENRDNQNLSAISSQYNAANENFNKGLWGTASSLASAGRSMYDFGGFTPQVDNVNSGVSQQGVSPLGGDTSIPQFKLPGR